MAQFDAHALNAARIRFDFDGLRRGYYSDKYFENVVRVLEAAVAQQYTFAGHSPRFSEVDRLSIPVGDLVVEAQIFTRHKPRALAAGIHPALTILRHCTGYFDQGAFAGQFIETWRHLDVEAVPDGTFLPYDGDPEHVAPAIKIRGRYRDFALLETPLLGVLSRATRIATHVYRVLEVANGKRVLYFPARFDLPEVQAVDGYAHWLAVQRYNFDTKGSAPSLVSTDAQGEWWGGRGVGTVPHALIAAFMADTAEAMVRYAIALPVDIPRIALVDFNNDSVGDAVRVLDAYWPHYRAALERNDSEAQRRWTLDGVRLDTSPNVRDIALQEGDPTGVSTKLVCLVRQALDDAWKRWSVPAELEESARQFCRQVRIVVTGGVSRDRIAKFEAEGAPIDTYGVGSSFLRNDPDTNTDFTMDVVRVFIDGEWRPMAKVGRRPNDNPDLRRVDLDAYASEI